MGGETAKRIDVQYSSTVTKRALVASAETVSCQYCATFINCITVRSSR